MAVRDDRGDVKQTTTGFRGPLMVQSLTSAKSKFLAVMQAIVDILDELGLGCKDIVRADVHLSNLDDFDVMDSVYRCFFEKDSYPARTTTESPRLFGDSKVEITVQARLKD